MRTLTLTEVGPGVLVTIPDWVVKGMNLLHPSHHWKIFALWQEMNEPDFVKMQALWQTMRPTFDKPYPTNRQAREDHEKRLAALEATVSAHWSEECPQCENPIIDGRCWIHGVPVASPSTPKKVNCCHGAAGSCPQCMPAPKTVAQLAVELADYADKFGVFTSLHMAAYRAAKVGA